MEVAFDHAFPILAVAGIGLLLLTQPKSAGAKWQMACTIVGWTSLIFAAILFIKTISASVST